MRAMVLVLVVATACTKKTVYYCDENTPCQLNGLVCDLPHNTCIEPADGPPGGGDGPSPDPQIGPVVHTVQPAGIVLGQPDFDSEADAGCVRNSANAVVVAEGNGILYVRELQERALGWTPLPSGN